MEIHTLPPLPSPPLPSVPVSPGVLHRLKSSSHPIQDGHTHLIPLCESLEAVLRTGLKREPASLSGGGRDVDVVALSPEPNSWFGLNKQDYWSWIEPLQDYYFNEKYTYCV